MVSPQINPLLVPKQTEIDLEPTLFKIFSSGGMKLFDVARQHKFKSAVLAILLFGTYKTYGLYRSFKEITSGVLSNEPSTETKQSEKSKSMNDLTAYLQVENPTHGVLQIKVFQQIMNRQKQNLQTQIKYICTQVVQPYFRLSEYKAAPVAPNQSVQQHVQRSTNIKDSLIKTLFGQVYAARIFNLLSLVQYFQGGKLFYQLSKAEIDSKKEPADTQQQTQPQMSQAESVQKQFIIKVYQDIIHPFVLKHLFPLIESCAAEHLEYLGVKRKVTITQMNQVFTEINNKIIDRLFSKGWLLKCLCELSEDFKIDNKDALSQELLNEWLDIIDTDIFMGTLYELITESFSSFIEKVESSIQATSGLINLNGSDQSVMVQKLVTFIIQLQESDEFVNVLLNDMQMYMKFDGVCHFEDMLTQLAKFSFFGKLYTVSMKDLMSDPQQIKDSNNGGDMDFMRELSKFSSEADGNNEGGGLSQLLSLMKD